MLPASLIISFLLSLSGSVLGTPTQLALSEDTSDASLVLEDGIPTFDPSEVAHEFTPGSHTAHVSTTMPSTTADPPPPVRVLNCSFIQELKVRTAVRTADALVQDATAYLAAHPYTAAGARYHAWFGAAPTFAQHARVATVFATMSMSSFAHFAYTCVPEAQCAGVVTRGAAYTTPWTPGIVFVCPGYVARPAIAQAGIFVHLRSQWATVGDTGHWAIGETDSKALAISNPFLAVDNGDSFALFAENYPPLA